MASIVPYSLVLAGLLLTVSLVVFGENNHDECALHNKDCLECVGTKINTTGNPNATIGNNGTCVWELASTGHRCVDRYEPASEINARIFNVDGCSHLPPGPNTTTSTTAATPTTPPSNGTTPAPPTTPSTAVPSTNGTTVSTTVAPTNGTTVPPSTTAIPTTNGTTPVPTSSTTAAPGPKPTPTPKTGGFSWASFIGGIVFAASLSSLAYLIWRFYKVRLDRNYHTLSTNLI